ncbi:MAG: hypothetical protein GOMPHAMPRED_002198 [Gomphillus americanus]|uniref:RNA polymerase Rpb4/RPC9 core domain-containing protein n=1 Tax=Gomphillus americanus TaxID=1940652 RepID=A0A8H3FCE3_9LECA|nr:MAG: hypothetical protein GOMPHAMPRED_002198 [Gomphillus americanus]
MSKQQPRSRPKESNIQDEEASSVLKLGEFEGVPTLSTSEAAVLISAVKAQRTKLGKPMKQTEVLTQVEDYLDIFARFKQKENVDAVERLLDGTPFERYERSQLASLCCADADEAKTLIPSIAAKMSDEDLDTVLDQINKLRSTSE